MNSNIFDLYDFVVSEGIELQFYDVVNNENPYGEIVMFVDRCDSNKFLELLDDNFCGIFDDGGFDVKIVSDGSLCVNLLNIIVGYCDDEDMGRWVSRFKRHCVNK